MKNSTSFNTNNTDSKLNTTTVLVLIVAALPILLFALTKMFPPTVDTTSKETTMSETKANRISAAERRAQRAEERRAKKAEKVATASVQYGGMPADPGMMNFPAPMEPMDFGGGFGPGMGFDNGMAMGAGGFGPGGFGPGMGPGMGFGPGMNGGVF